MRWRRQTVHGTCLSAHAIGASKAAQEQHQQHQQQQQQEQQSFVAAWSGAGLGHTHGHTHAEMGKRQACPADFVSCDGLGGVFAGTCCADGAVCSPDASNQAGCCPRGALCTGTIPPPGAAPTPTPTATSTSYVTDQYWAFPAIPTSFPNSGACSAAVSLCGRNYASCTSALQSETTGHGVTIQIPGGAGITVAPTRTARVPEASATSICATLSAQACHGLQSSRCGQTGNGGDFFVGTANGQARPTAAYALAFVAGVCAVGVNVNL